MKFSLGPLASDIFISLYAIATLYIRFKFESQASLSALNSIVLGICFLTFIWVFIKIKILNPNWFGLFNTKK